MSIRSVTARGVPTWVQEVFNEVQGFKGFRGSRVQRVQEVQEVQEVHEVHEARSVSCPGVGRSHAETGQNP
jgi:hypothetical protein